MEVARSKTDAFGYDLVLSSGSVTRHVQLKASRSLGKTSRQKINKALGQKQSGCVIWVKINDDTLAPEIFGWLGGAPGDRMSDFGTRIAKHTKAKAQGVKNLRPNIREVGWGEFKHFSTIGEVFVALSGGKES